MSIELYALKMKLSGENIPTQYLSKDLQFIINKSEIYRKKNGKYPSIDFLLSSVNKMTSDSEIVKVLTDKLYATSVLKDTEMSAMEVSELLLDEYKQENVRELTKQLATAFSKDLVLEIPKLSKKLDDICNLSLSQNYLSRDIKNDVKVNRPQVVKLPTGILNGKSYAISYVPRGSLILVLGRSGKGKSTLTLQSMLENYLAGYNCINFNFELGLSTILNRIKACLTEVPIQEIMDNEFLLDESKEKVWLTSFVLSHQISMKDAYIKLVELKFDREAFEQYLVDIPLRQNIMKIVAAEEAGVEGAIESLPTDDEIINIIKEYGDNLDNVYIDLVSEVNFSNGFNSREQNLTNFARTLNEVALLKGVNVFMVSQIEGVKSYDSLNTPKYSKGLFQSASLVISLISNAEMAKDGIVGLVPVKARHAKTNEVYFANADFEIQKFTECYETLDSYDFEEMINKELKKKSDKK